MKTDIGVFAKLNERETRHTDSHPIALTYNIPLEEIIDGYAQRLPFNLISERPTRRHERVVDDSTGETVGYARWFVPAGYEDMWSSAQIPAPTAKDKKSFEDLNQQNMVNGIRRGANMPLMRAMGDPLQRANDEVVNGGLFLGALQQRKTTRLMCCGPDSCRNRHAHHQSVTSASRARCVTPAKGPEASRRFGTSLPGHGKAGRRQIVRTIWLVSQNGHSRPSTSLAYFFVDPKIR